MNTKNAFILIFITTILLSFSCQSDQQTNSGFSADDYILNIYSRYLQLEKEFKVEVSFNSRKDKKLKNQSIEGDLFFRGRKLSKIDARFGGMKYMTQLPKEPYKESKVIEWKKENTVLGTYQSTLPQIETFQIEKNTIELSKGFRLSWEGAPLTKEEFITIVITPELSDPLRLNRLGPTETSYFRVLGKQLEKLTPGTCQLSIIRNKRTNIRDKDGNLNAMFIDEYHMGDQQIILK